MNIKQIIQAADKKINYTAKTIYNNPEFTRVDYTVGEYDISLTFMKHTNSPVRYMIHEFKFIRYCDWGNSKNFFKYLSYITGNGPETQRFMNINKPYKARKH